MAVKESMHGLTGVIPGAILDQDNVLLDPGQDLGQQEGNDEHPDQLL